MGGPFHERNQRSRARLEALVGSLTRDDYALEAEGGWTVGALLAHVSFWDRFVAGRWQHAHVRRLVSPITLADGIDDLVNGAAIPIWRALPAEAVAEIALDAAAIVDEEIELLSEAAIEAVTGEGRHGLVDRSLHRTEHLDAIERALADAGLRGEAVR